jgi:FixJ family two-component response regulator
VAAIEVWQQHQAEIKLLFTDMVMPGKMSGLELGQRLLQDKPGLKVVYTSGYTDEMLKEGSELRHSPNFLEKPYGTEVLLRKIRTALDS